MAFKLNKPPYTSPLLSGHHERGLNTKLVDTTKPSIQLPNIEKNLDPETGKYITSMPNDSKGRPYGDPYYGMNREEERIARGEGVGLDIANATMTGAGITPAYGAVADLANVGFSGSRMFTNFLGDSYNFLTTGDFDFSRTGARGKDMFAAGVGIAPFAGQVVSGGKLAADANKLNTIRKNIIGSNKIFKAGKVIKEGFEGEELISSKADRDKTEREKQLQALLNSSKPSSQRGMTAP